MSFLLEAVRAWAPRFEVRDPIVGAFLQKYEASIPYSDRELQSLQIDQEAWSRELERIRTFRPAVISVGGDYLDFLLAAEMFDLAQAGLKLYRNLCLEVGARLVMTVYVGYFALQGSVGSSLRSGCDALMVPVNTLGLGMLPDREGVLSWLKSMGKPVIAMHVLGSGKLEPTQALAYIFREARVAAAVVGASTVEHIDKLIQSGREVLGDELL